MKATLMKLAFNTIAASALLSFSFTALALSDSATPATPDAPATPQITPTKPGLHFLLNGGLTYGGDTIYTAVFTNGDTSNIKGGSFVQFGMGALWQAEGRPLALLLSANYHMDNVSATNGKLEFKRIPIELLAYYTGKERFRIGGGLRIVNSPEAGGTVNNSTDKIVFDNTTGLVAEVGYQLTTPSWLNFRFVSEKYNAKSHNGTPVSGGVPLSGSHLGVNYSYEF